MRTKGAIYLIVFVIAVIVGIFQFGINNLSGCTGELLSRFKRLELAQVYEREYLASMKLPDDVRRLSSINSRWEIEKQGNGCKVQFVASYFYLKNYVYFADEFFINLQDEEVYPISDGAKLLLDYYKFQTKLP